MLNYYLFSLSFSSFFWHFFSVILSFYFSFFLSREMIITNAYRRGTRSTGVTFVYRIILPCDKDEPHFRNNRTAFGIRARSASYVVEDEVPWGVASKEYARVRLEYTNGLLMGSMHTLFRSTTAESCRVSWIYLGNSLMEHRRSVAFCEIIVWIGLNKCKQNNDNEKIILANF